MNIIQIGCNDCNDHLKDYVRENYGQINKLILVDPNEIRINNCHKVYEPFNKNIDFKIIVKAINAQNSDKLILYHNPNETNGHHTSVHRQHLIDHHHSESDIVGEEFPSVKLNDLLDEHNISVVDRLYVDTEGYDIDILRSIDYNRFKIKYIQFESTHSDGSFSGFTQKLSDFIDELNELGYSFINAPYGEVIAVLSKP